MNENHLYQQTHENMIFSAYTRICYKYDIVLLEKKRKMPLPRKSTSQVDISGITEKDDIHPRKYGISAEIPR